MLLRVLCAVPAGLLRRLQGRIPAELARLEPCRRSLIVAAAHGAHDLVIVDQARLGADPGAFFRRLHAMPDSPEAIVLADAQDPEVRASLLAAGALAVLDPALADEPLAEAVRALLVRRREALVPRLPARGDTHGGLQDFVSESPVMERFLSVAHKVVDSDSSLLIQGETGVGKERFARAMHDEGPRKAGPFIAVNCGALSEALLESELFGHEEGAFTGAVRAHRGYFELAHGGTLFLDELGDMPQLLQVKLLRALQERRIRPVGGERDLAVDVRLIAATNRDLQREVREGRFRADLYYRLAVVALTIPPLRERRDDIPQLVGNHLEALCARFNRRPFEVADEAMAALRRYDWPGNVRELVNVLERAVLLADGPRLALQDLPEAIARADALSRTLQPDDGLYALPLRAALVQVSDSFERDYLQRLLRASGGRLGPTAARAGLSPRALFTKMHRLGLRKEDFRSGEVAQN